MSAESFETKRTLTVSEAEESVLVEMVMFFNDMGWINEESQTEYDSLVEKICEPASWEYN